MLLSLLLSLFRSVLLLSALHNSTIEEFAMNGTLQGVATRKQKRNVAVPSEITCHQS